MNRNEIMQKMNAIFVDLFDDNGIVITDETTAADINGWDSLAHITLIAEIEDAFDIKFTMKEVINMKNIGEMIDVVEREIQ